MGLVTLFTFAWQLENVMFPKSPRVVIWLLIVGLSTIHSAEDRVEL